MQTSRVTIVASTAFLLGTLPLIAAHGDEHAQGEHGHGPVVKPEVADSPPNYFRHPEYAGWMYAHIALLIIAWVFVLPPALMLSVARSRYHLPSQVFFHVLNGLGLFTGFVYNHSTPDLYVTNSHHPAGWAITALSTVWTIISFATILVAPRKQRDGHEASAFQHTARTEDAYQQYVDSPASYRFSSDSGNFCAGSRADSSDSIFDKDEHIPDEEHDSEDDAGAGSRGFIGNGRVERSLSRFTARISGTRVSAALRFSQIVLEKFLLILGFLAITTGFVVYGGLFQKREVYSGLAHYIKGAIFFWYGLLTLGRWMGAFAEFGWAWNIRPSGPLVARWNTMVPSAEFTESFVIWLYGTSNVFLEHMNNWGGQWSPHDFEHVSITILFFGGGLFGMIIESRLVRDLASPTVGLQKSGDHSTLADNAGFRGISGFSAAQNGGHKRLERPAFSLNPMPALTIMFLGMMMSRHHQNSTVSTMMHAQWGMLFTGFAMARAVTYLILYIKPPASHFPSRPPSELVAALFLTAGGILFMNSAHDSVTAIELHGLDAMTIFPITIGFTGIIMAWEVICFTIKSWAATKEHRASRL